MAAWQHDYRLLPQAKLKEHYGRVPEMILTDDYEKIDWWGGIPEPNPEEIERILPPTKSWSEQVKIWGSDRGNRISLIYEEGGALQSVELRIDLRQEYPKVRELIQLIILLAEKNEYCFRNDDGVILMPDYTALAEDMKLSDAQHFMNTSPAALFVDGL